MQTVHKSPRSGRTQGRIVLLAAALIALAAVIAMTLLLTRDSGSDWPTVVSTAETLFDYAPSQVASISITRRNEAPWTVTQADGLLMLAGEDGFPLSGATSAALLDAACNIPCEAVLTNEAAEYQDRLADFGLDAPRYEAVITYADGVSAHLRVGNPGTENNAWYYMTVGGDDRLFSFSRGMVEALFVSRESLREVVSPTIHKVRIDQLTLTGAEGIQAQWTLQGKITDMDAADKWQLSAPIVYPADAAAVDTLLSNAANLRLGAYVCPAAADKLQEYGFESPRLTIDIHMAAGTIGNTNAEGALVSEDYPESTVTFVIGDAKNDMVDYVLYGDSIYVSSHFTMGMFIDYDARSTMSRYPIMTALGNLASLKISTPQKTLEYVLTRTERVAKNNELVTDTDGSVVYDVTVTCNGESYSYDAFAAAYSAWTLTTVSGTLPKGESSADEPHSRYVFTDVDGTVHTLELSAFDALHDAVIVDGHQAFYIIRGGLNFPLSD